MGEQRARPGETPRSPRRRYRAVGVREIPSAAPEADGRHRAPTSFALLLDDQPLLTPGEHTFAVPTRTLAEEIAAEWAAQGPLVVPQRMPLTRLANSAIDGVRGREPAVREDIANYGACDLLCYRADRPAALVRRQRAAWDEIVTWASAALGVTLRITAGVMPIAQPGEVRMAIRDAFALNDCFGLAALHVITNLTGSALLALAVARGRLSAEAAWEAAHVDEQFQIAQWGEDAEAAQRQQLRWVDMAAACRMLQLLA